MHQPDLETISLETKKLGSPRPKHQRFYVLLLPVPSHTNADVVLCRRDDHTESNEEAVKPLAKRMMGAKEKHQEPIAKRRGRLSSLRDSTAGVSIQSKINHKW